MSHSVAIRTARLIDLDPIVKLWRELLGHHQHLEPRLYSTVIHAPASFRAFIRRKMDDHDAFVLVAESSEGVVGYLLGSVGQRAPVYTVRTVGMIFDLMVAPAVRGRGIGRSLVNEASHRFAQREIHDLQVNYDPRNEEANRFWAAMGFQTLLHEAYRQNP